MFGMYGTAVGCAAAWAMLGLFQLCGLCAALRLFPQQAPGPKLLLGSVLGSVEMQWFPALAAFFFGFDLRAHLAGLGLAVACAAASLIFLKERPHPGTALKRLGSSLAHRPFFWAVLAVWGFFCFLVLHSFRWEDGQVFSSQATYGDMAMHLSFITSLATQGTFPPNYSLLPGARLSYPFLSDSISASLYLAGGSLRLAYCLPMLLAGAQVLWGGWLLLRQLLNGRGRSALAWIFFFFNGGLGVLWFLGGEPGNFTRIFTEFYQTPTNYTVENLRWVNVIVDMMLPQRATLFGWAVLFPALYLLFQAVFQGEKRLFPLVGLLAGALPMIHTHSFLALALVCGAWLTAGLCQSTGLSDRALQVGRLLVPIGLVVMTGLQALLTRLGKTDASGLLVFACAGLGLWAATVAFLAVQEFRAGRGPLLARTWGLLLLVTCLLALPQLFTWTFRQVGAGGMVRGHFGWVIGQDNYLWFYLKNLGLAGVLAVMGLLTAQKEAFARYCPALTIWFVAEFIEFQPNDYDNNKLLYVGYLFLCCAAADALCQLLARLKDRRVQACTAAVAVTALSSSAVLTMGREAVASYSLFGQGALSLCQYIEDNVPADAVILTDQRHNNEVASLSGRNVVCGSPAYLYYHGLPYYANQKAAQQMYEDPQGNQALFSDFRVEYVLVSDFEQSSFAVDIQDFDRMGFTRVFDDDVRVLFKVPDPNAPAS